MLTKIILVNGIEYTMKQFKSLHIERGGKEELRLDRLNVGDSTRVKGLMVRRIK